MDLTVLRTFVAVAEAGSLSTAASRLGLPVSTVSRRVAEVEAWAGRPLFRRTGRGMRLIDEAHGLPELVLSALTALDGAAARVRAGETPLRSVRIATSPELALRVLPDVLAEVLRAHPHTRFVVRSEPRRVGLHEEGFDLAVRVGRAVRGEALVRRLPPTTLALVAPPRSPATIEALASAPRVRVLGAPEELLPSVEGVRVEGQVVAEATTFAEALELVGRGLGWTQAPAFAVVDALRERRVRAVRVPGPPKRVPLQALWPPHHRLQPEIRAIVDATAAALRQREEEWARLAER